MNSFFTVIQALSWAWGLCACAAGLKAAIFNNGPGPLELIGMFWRGEIKGHR